MIKIKMKFIFMHQKIIEKDEWVNSGDRFNLTYKNEQSHYFLFFIFYDAFYLPIYEHFLPTSCNVLSVFLLSMLRNVPTIMCSPVGLCFYGLLPRSTSPACEYIRLWNNPYFQDLDPRDGSGASEYFLWCHTWLSHPFRWYVALPPRSQIYNRNLN